MRHPILLAVGAVLLASFPVASQAQGIRFHGIPSSATSVGPNGESHGIPSSVTSPTFDNPDQGIFFNGTHVFNGAHVGQRRMGVPQSRRHRGGRVVAVPVYVPGYSLPYYMYEPEPVVEDQPADNPPPEPPARTIFERRSTTVTDNPEDEASDSRYGEHYLDSRETRRRKPVKTEDTEAPAKAPSEKQIAEAHPDSLPGTVLIFKDGHRSEVHDYAIVGENLFDLGTVHVMKKIPLAMLDLPATRKENEQNGVDFRVP
jgi:hypothetical protein